MKRQWWKESVVYQIYPRSFYDSNGDGIGDLRGIIEKVDYLQKLGIDVVWLCPVYESPNDDNGYDISDYHKIMQEFGTMADWEELLDELHKRGIRLIMDLVVNHTSDEHPWFVESRSSKDNPYRDYYIWRPGKDGREPNNWVSCFSGSAWQYDEQTGEYYLHIFSKKQPDLNWDNPRVREEVYELMLWWLDKGIDGFRMDVINFLSKAEGLPSVPVKDGGYAWGGKYFVNGPNIHRYLGEMKERVLSKYDILTVGETPGVTPEDAISYTNEQTGAMNMVFQFEHMEVDIDPNGTNGKWDIVPWKLSDMKRIYSKWQTALYGKGWNSLYLENHDQPRSVSRFGNDREYRVESAKMLATFLHMMQGTPFIYQGQEIGMTNVAFPSISDYRDVEILNMYREQVVEKGRNPQDVLACIHYMGRDNARTPMQWDDSPNAGFTTGVPWIGVNPNYVSVNVKQALEDPQSIFYHYQKLIRLRKEHPIIVNGKFELILEEHEQIFAYIRTLENQTLLVLANFTGREAEVDLSARWWGGSPRLLISNYPEEGLESSVPSTLRPFEALVYLFS